MNSRFLKQKVFWRTRDDKRHDGESFRLLSQDGNFSEEDDEDVAFNRRSYDSQRKRPAAHYIEHKLQSGETLLSLALRYNCSVAQIKQANNILRENEVFALRTVRIPVPLFSHLRGDIPGIHSPLNPKRSDRREETEDNNSAVTPSTKSNAAEDCGVSLSDEELHNPLLTPIPVPRLPLVEFSDSEPSDLHLPALSVPQKEVADGILNCSGADCGISWVALVLCTLILGFAGPLIYIFFLYEHEQERKMHNETGT